MDNKTNQLKTFNKNSPQSFENSWSVTYRKPNYDALNDPHASYYFLNKYMKKHLKMLKKSIEMQSHSKQKNNIKKLIEQKVEDFDKFNKFKIDAYLKMQQSRTKRIRNLSNSSVESMNTIQNEETQNQSFNLDILKKQNQRKKIKSQRTANSKTIDISDTNEQMKNQNKTLLPKIQFKPKPIKINKNELIQAQMNMSNSKSHDKLINFILSRKKQAQALKQTIPKQ